MLLICSLYLSYFFQRTINARLPNFRRNRFFFACILRINWRIVAFLSFYINMNWYAPRRSLLFNCCSRFLFSFYLFGREFIRPHRIHNTIQNVIMHKSDVSNFPIWWPRKRNEENLFWKCSLFSRIPITKTIEITIIVGINRVGNQCAQRR